MHLFIYSYLSHFESSIRRVSTYCPPGGVGSTALGGSSAWRSAAVRVRVAGSHQAGRALYVGAETKEWIGATWIGATCLSTDGSSDWLSKGRGLPSRTMFCKTPCSECECESVSVYGGLCLTSPFRLFLGRHTTQMVCEDDTQMSPWQPRALAPKRKKASVENIWGVMWWSGRTFSHVRFFLSSSLSDSYTVSSFPHNGRNRDEIEMLSEEAWPNEWEMGLMSVSS